MMTNPNQQPDETPPFIVWLVLNSGGLRIEYTPTECAHENIYTGDGIVTCWKCGKESALRDHKSVDSDNL
jgi:hypothetical protein